MYNNYNNENGEDAVKKFKEDYTDGRNRCKRCHHPLNNSTDEYGWRCEQILGLNQNNPLQKHFWGQDVHLSGYNEQQSLDNLPQETYNDFVKSFLPNLQGNVEQKKQYPYINKNLLSTIKTTNKTTRPGETRTNHKGEKYWCSDPDAEDYGENSVKYKMLYALGSRWKNSKNDAEKHKLHTASKMIRTYEANVDANDITKVLLLNDENGANTLGHNAVMLLSSKGEGVLFSFFPEGKSAPYANGQTRFKLLTKNQVDDFKESGRIYNTTALGKYSYTIQDETYTRYIEIAIKPQQGANMLKRGLKHAANPKYYQLFGNQCDDTAADIMKAGGCGYYVFNLPNWSFDVASKSWRAFIQNIRR